VVKIFFAIDTKGKDFNTEDTENTEKNRKGANYGGHPIQLSYEETIANRNHPIDVFGGALRVHSTFRAATGSDERAWGNGRAFEYTEAGGCSTRSGCGAKARTGCCLE
jgi:hypothetical protein